MYIYPGTSSNVPEILYRTNNGYAPAPLLINSRAIVIRFQTSSNTGAGFQLRYQVNAYGDLSVNGPSNGLIKDNNYNMEIGIIESTGRSGMFSDGSDSDLIKPNQSGKYRINVPGNKVISLYFAEFSLGCNTSITIYQGYSDADKVFARYEGGNDCTLVNLVAPPPLTITGDQVFIVFNTKQLSLDNNSDIKLGGGWQIYYCADTCVNLVQTASTYGTITSGNAPSLLYEANIRGLDCL